VEKKEACTRGIIRVCALQRAIVASERFRSLIPIASEPRIERIAEAAMPQCKHT